MWAFQRIFPYKALYLHDSLDSIISCLVGAYTLSEGACRCTTQVFYVIQQIMAIVML